MTATAVVAPRAIETFADLHLRLGEVPLSRIRMRPAPGTATEADLLTRPNGERRLFELVDGVLVEKPMGYYESLLAGILVGFLRAYLEHHDLGFLLLPDATLRLAPGLVRLPDISFVLWDRYPNRELPAEPIPVMPPDLAIEIISDGNTPTEMERKLQEYFTNGVRLVWCLYPAERALHVYTSPTDVRVLREDEILDGGTMLPGFQIAIREIFNRSGQRPPRP